MRGSLLLAWAALQSTAVTALPATPAGRLFGIRGVGARSPANPFAALRGGGGGNKEDVQNAASSFAGDVAVVSASLNGMGTTTDPQQVRTMARKAFAAEEDEDRHRAVLNRAAGGGARQANQKIVDNTPIVLDGLESMMRNPSTRNVMKQLSRVESARNANILPSITQLSNSAFENSGVGGQAKRFEPTTGTQSLRQLVAGGGPGAGTANSNKGGATGAGNKGAGATAAKGAAGRGKTGGAAGDGASGDGDDEDN